MLRAIVFAFVTIFVTASLARSLADSPPLQITHLTMQKVMGGNVTFEFTVYNPDKLANTTDVCEGEWRTASKAFPTGSYKPCGGVNSTFAWHLEDFETIKSYTLGVEHTFTDPSLGDPPYDRATNFGRVTINENTVPCTKKGRTTTCKNTKMIKAPIYAIMAKK